MAALGSLIRGDLPPVGNSIRTKSASGDAILDFQGYFAVMLGSGTMALALAMLVIKRRHRNITTPKVILPAYACPDLVAASICAGLLPVVVDIDFDTHCYNLEALSDALDEDIIAVIAVNFLGIPERLSQIRSVVEDWPAVALIEDNAQWYPELVNGRELQGDFVCLSFGRGKPVSLLGGGVLLVADTWELEDEVVNEVGAAVGGKISLQLKLHVYNRLLNPHCYQFLSRNPLLNIGETVFKSLTIIRLMDQYRLSLLGANIDAYLGRGRDVEYSVAAIVAKCPESLLVDLSRIDVYQSARLLRYPILCVDKENRDQLFQILNKQGIGVSMMYRQPLNMVSGVAGLVHSVNTNNKGAENFADRLLTLPVHEGVSDQVLNRLADVLNAYVVHKRS